MNPLLWTPKINFAADDEGAGGGDEPDRMSKLESRLAKLGEGVEALLKGNTVREQQERTSQISAVEQRLDSALQTARTELDTAETALTSALDNGDAATIAKAHRAVAEKAARLERTQGEVDVAKQRLKTASEERTKQAPTTDGKVDTSNLEAFKAKNRDWYGVDTEMTKAAHDADQTIRAAGVHTPGSKEYFAAVTNHVARLFPDKLKGSPSSTAMNREGAVTEKPGQTRIDASLAEGWTRMGIDMKDPKVVERMLKHRQTLVEKNILPQRQEVGRVYTR